MANKWFKHAELTKETGICGRSLLTSTICVLSPKVCIHVPFMCLLPMHKTLPTQAFHVVSTEPEIEIANKTFTNYQYTVVFPQ